MGRRGTNLVGIFAEYGPDPNGYLFSRGNLPYKILGMALGPTSEEVWKEAVEREALAPLGMITRSPDAVEGTVPNVGSESPPSHEGKHERL